MEIRLLGPLEVRIDGREVTLGGPKVRALLAVLLLNANRTVAVETLIDALWGDEPPGSARQTVHYFVHRLRRALGAAGDRLATSPSGYELHVAPGELDVDTFERLTAQARTAAADGDLDAAAATLDQAVALWRGRPLADLTSAPFAEAEAARLEALHATAMEERFEIGLRLGRHTELVAELEAMTAAYPFRERPRAQLMLALYRSGRRAEALAAFSAARRTFSEELGIEPGPQLQRLERAILTSDPSIELPRTSTPPPVTRAPAPDPAPPPPPAEAPARPRREERKVVTVLVAGLVRAEEQALDPEDAHRRLTTALARIRAQVERFGGTIQAVLGATAFAVFGVPTAHDDDQERAVRAALALTAPEDDEGGDRLGERLAVRAGIDTGEAMVTPPGDAGPSVVGEVVDRAATLSTIAAAGEILVSRGVARATRAAIELTPAPAGAERVLGTRSRTGAAGPPAAPSPLIERDPELALLRGLLGRVRLSNDPQLVTIVGSPGVGKSRLIHELGQVVDADPELVSWRQGRSLAYGDAITFDALAELVKAHAGILETDPAGVAEAKLAAAVADTGEEAAADWMRRHLLPLVSPDPKADAGTSQRAEAFTAWRRFLEALAAQRPLVLVFEDLHWADDALLEFIDELADRAGPVPLMIVCAGRPELLDRRPGWGGGKRNATTLSLAPLTATGTTSCWPRCSTARPSPPRPRPPCATRPGATRCSSRSTSACSTTSTWSPARPPARPAARCPSRSRSTSSSPPAWTRSRPGTRHC